MVQSQEPDQINKNQIFGGPQSFRLLITASSGMGKSKLIENLLTDPSWGIIKKFDVDCIFVFSPTLNIDPCWKTIKSQIEGRQSKDHQFVESEQFFSSDLEQQLSNVYQQLVDKQLEYKHQDKDPVSKILILDDCLLEVNFSTSSSQLARMLVKMRHYNISIIVVSQYLKSIHPIARAQFNVYITFQTSNSQEIKKIQHEISSTMKSSTFLELYNFCTSQRYSYLMVVFNFPLKFRYFRGLGSQIEQLQI